MNPKEIDQPWRLPSGELTENAKFAQAAADFPNTRALVSVYEKLRDGIWTDKGFFELVGYTYSEKSQEGRRVFRFTMQLSDSVDDVQAPEAEEFKRVIPSWAKQAVYNRDKGRCVICGAQDQLHFDHDLPFAKGGTGLTPANVRILCARHNLAKGATIE